MHRLPPAHGPGAVSQSRSDGLPCSVLWVHQFRAGWRTSRWAWTGLAAVWAVILALNLAAREPDAPLMAGQEVPSASEMRLAVGTEALVDV